MTESRNFYMNASSRLRDWLLDQYESSRNPLMVRNSLKKATKIAVAVEDVKEAIVLSYVDSGESEKAFDLAIRFRSEIPNSNMHNLVIKSMLSSWQYTQELFLDESIAWSNLYAGENAREFVPYCNANPRIGFVCDYGSTVFGENAIFPMCLALEKSGFDVFYYNFERITFSIKDSAVKILNAHKMSVQELSKKIINDKIDILVDLNGRLRDHHRLGVFANRSAPVQLNYFNLVGTMGMKSYDYIIVDEVQVPRSDERYYVEKVLRLPSGVNGAFKFKRDVPVATFSDHVNSAFTFASFNAFFKCNSVLLQSWAEILLKVPNSRLVIKCFETERERVIRKISAEFSRSGVDLSRIYIEGWSSLNVLRKQYSSVDLCLDTFPYSGGSSTLNSIWQGVPVLTLCGDGWRSRSTASILSASNLRELIAYSRQEYIEKAVYFATHRRELCEIRRCLMSAPETNNYFNTELVYSDFAECLKKVYQRGCVPEVVG